MKHYQTLTLKLLRNEVRGHALCQTLDHLQLARSRRTQQDRSSLAAPRENLDNSFDLSVSVQNRGEFALLGLSGEVNVQLIHSRGRVRSTSTFTHTAVIASIRHLRDLRARILQAHPHCLQYSTGNAVTLADQSQEQMFRAEVAVVELKHFVHRQLEHFPTSRRQRNITDDSMVTPINEKQDFISNPIQINAKFLEHLSCDAVNVANETQQQMFSADIVVVQGMAFFHCHAKSIMSSLRKFGESIFTVHGTSFPITIGPVYEDDLSSWSVRPANLEQFQAALTAQHDSSIMTESSAYTVCSVHYIMSRSI
jgi:hypothetical protein